MGLLAISKWELRRRRFSFNRNTLVLSLLLVILIAGVSFFVSLQGIHINDNLYKVLVTDPDLAPVISSDNRFEVYIAKEHDAKALFSFKGVVVGIPFIVLEELDTFKREGGEKGHNVREAIRQLDALVSDCAAEAVKFGVVVERGFVND